MTRHPFQSSSFDRQASLYLNHQMNEKMHYDDRKYFDSKMTVKLIKVEPKGFGHVSYTAPPNPSQRSALPCQCYRGVLWSISAPAEKRMRLHNSCSGCFTENIKICHLTVNCMLLVAIMFLKAKSCSTKIMVGQNSLISFSICIRE